MKRGRVKLNRDLGRLKEKTQDSEMVTQCILNPSQNPPILTKFSHPLKYSEMGHIVVLFFEFVL